MQPLIFATTNEQKFAMARYICDKVSVPLEQMVINIDEIQGEEPEKIVQDKARRAFEAITKPVIVSDDSWAIHGLNGFPGAYMKSMNEWLRAEDFLNLTKDLEDRRVTLYQYLAYQDELETVIFTSEVHGALSLDIRGKTDPPFLKIVMLDMDHGQTISEVYDQGKELAPERVKAHPDAWHQVAKWYKKKLS